MSNLELNTRVSTILVDTERELRMVLLDAARTIQKHEGIEQVELTLEDGLSGIVDGNIGAITVSGQPVGNVWYLLKLLTALDGRLSGASVAAVVPTPIVAEKQPEVVLPAVVATSGFAFDEHEL